ncbi:MAG: hypothetical protein Fur0041_20280 [Bacteroidia bacterium]
MNALLNILRDEKFRLPLLLIITVLSRIPFIFDGYGVEEDSWGLVVNSWQMHETGHYVASRFPGHPFQEYIYSFIFNSSPAVYNFLSTIWSMAAVGFFYAALRKMQMNSAFPVTIMLLFTPSFYIAGTYTIDYAWTLAFVMMSFYFLTADKPVVSGIVLGFAIGCRITTGVFLLPWLMLIWNSMDFKTSFRAFLKIAVPAGVTGILWFVPAYLQYGFSFFDYSDQFPYPPFAKIAYKASIGVFGLPGLIALAYYAIVSVRKIKAKDFNAVTLFSSERLLLACLVIVALHIISYLRLPQKSGYMMPIVPFVYVMFALVLNEKQLRNLAFVFIVSPFIFSINLTDTMRGAAHSALAVKFQVSGQEIFIDPLTGPVFSEKSKRLNKMDYCSKVIAATDTITQPSLIIGGWWYNEIITEHYTRRQNPLVTHRFYVTCSTLDSAAKAGMKSYYLSEQDLYNDQMFGQECTHQYTSEFPVKN